MKSGFCAFFLDVVLIFGCICVIASEMKILWISFGCVIVFRLYLCGCY